MFKLRFHIHYDKPLKIQPMTKEEVLDCWKDKCLPGEERNSSRIECYENILIVHTPEGDAIYDYRTGEGYNLTITEL